MSYPENITLENYMNNPQNLPFLNFFGTDTVKFRMRITAEQKRNLCQRILRRRDVDHRQIFTARYYRGLRLWLFGPVLAVQCSAATFMNRHNVWGLPLSEVSEFILAISDVLRFDVSKAELLRLDLALDIQTLHPSSQYVRILNRLHPYKRTIFPDDGGVSLRTILRSITQYAKDEAIRNMPNIKVTDRNGEKYYRRDVAVNVLESLGNPYLVRHDLSTRRKGLYKLAPKGTQLRVQDLHNPTVYEAILRKYSQDMNRATFINVVADDPEIALVSGRKERDAFATRKLIQDIGVDGYDNLLWRSFRAGKMDPKMLKRMRVEAKDIVQTMVASPDDFTIEFTTKLFTAITQAVESLQQLPNWMDRISMNTDEFLAEDGLVEDNGGSEIAEEYEEDYEEEYEDEYESNYDQEEGYLEN